MLIQGCIIKSVLPFCSILDGRSRIGPLPWPFSLRRSISPDGPVLSWLGAEPSAQSRRHRSNSIVVRQIERKQSRHSNGNIANDNYDDDNKTVGY
jgi:hypothetical protein